MGISLEMNVFDPVLIVLFWIGLVLLALWLVGLLFPTTRTRSDHHKNQILVDFNLACNPYCAYSPDFSCPLPPVENWLTAMAIRAGEKMYQKSDS